MLSLNGIVELSKIHRPNCISIYLQTHARGASVLKKEDQQNFIALLREIETKLIPDFKNRDSVRNYLAPLRELGEEDDFWRHQDEGLAVFLYDEDLHFFKLPTAVTERFYISNNLLIWPLLKWVPDEFKYYVLTLTLGEVHLYQGSQFQFKELPVPGLKTLTMEKVVGGDYEPKQLQYHSQQKAQASAIFHGSGEGKDDVKEEIERYYRAVNEAVLTVVKDRTDLLILVGLDHLTGIYKGVNTYSFLHNQNLPVNPDTLNRDELFIQSWQIMKSTFETEVLRKREAFMQYLGTDKASDQISEILPNALVGRVDTLFIKEDGEVWGIYDPSISRVRLDSGQQRSNVSLLNLLAIETIVHGGKVYIENGNNLPDLNTAVCALYRY